VTSIASGLLGSRPSPSLTAVPKPTLFHKKRTIPVPTRSPPPTVTSISVIASPVIQVASKCSVTPTAIHTETPEEESEEAETVSKREYWSRKTSYNKKWAHRAKTSVRRLYGLFNDRSEYRHLWGGPVTILDIGSGPLKLVKKYLPKRATYVPCDLVARDEKYKCEVDLNLDDNEKGVEMSYKVDGHMIETAPVSLEIIRSRINNTYPAIDAITMLGVGEYVVDMPRLFRQLRRFNVPVVFAYSSTDRAPYNDLETRKKNKWISHLTAAELVACASNEGFQSHPHPSLFINVFVPV